MEENELKELAKFCLSCKNGLCTKGCPMSTNVAKVTAEIKNGNYEQAYKTLIENNIFSPICSLICPQEQQCEGSCVKGIKGEPVQIGKIEHLLNKWARANDINAEIERKENNGIKVALIGSGPASISCAFELAKKGYNCTIFEKDENFGGILRYGIPGYRLPKTELDSIIEQAKKLGIIFKANVEFGKDITKETLKEEGYRAIFLGMGAQNPMAYSLSTNKAKQIYNPDYFLKEYNKGNELENLGTVVVIGGGNVAIDCARSAIRCKSSKDVYILYRRDRCNMPARDIEIEEAIADGVKINYQTKVIGATVEEDGNISEIECIKTEVIDKKACDIPNSNFKMKADTIIFAIGLSVEKDYLEKCGLEFENGLLKINEEGQTNIDYIFAGGDLTESKSTVCRAVAAGKKAAMGIINLPN